MRVLAIAVLAFLSLGCEGGATPSPDGSTCTVVRYSVAGEDPVCAVQCAWWRVHKGYATSTKVSCSWQGKQVTTTQ
jgi:hypothetical protein